MEQTAKDFLKNKVYITKDSDVDEDGDVHDSLHIVSEAMVEFAKRHVEAALKAALENAPIGCRMDVPSYEEMEDAIFSAYPLNNIG